MSRTLSLMREGCLERLLVLGHDHSCIQYRGSSLWERWESSRELPGRIVGQESESNTINQMRAPTEHASDNALLVHLNSALQLEAATAMMFRLSFYAQCVTALRSILSGVISLHITVVQGLVWHVANAAFCS